MKYRPKTLLDGFGEATEQVVALRKEIARLTTENQKLRAASGWTPLTCANCGHKAADHVRLPGHPDGAMECYGSDFCGCGSIS